MLFLICLTLLLGKFYFFFYFIIKNIQFLNFKKRCLYFYKTALSNSDDLNMNYLFGSVQICKVLFILNYGLKFFIYCATGSYFRNQLNQIKTKSIFSKFLTFYYMYQL